MQARAVGGTLLACAVAGVVGIAVWVLRSDGTESSRPAPGVAAPAPKPSDAPSPPVPVATSAAARDAEPIAAPPVVAEVPEPVGVELTVVDAATKLPYADAELWAIDAGEEDAAERDALANDPDRLVDRFGTKLEVDRNAVAHLPVQPAVEVVARAPDRFARKVVQSGDGPRQVVLLLPDQPLRVRVVDARGGRRADVPLVLESVDSDEARFDAERAAAERDDEDDRDSFRKRVARRPTVARGDPAKLWEGRIPQTGEDAEVPHGALLLLLSTEPDRIARARVLRFRLDVPLDVPSVALVDPRLDVHKTIVLVAPDLAKLRVRLVESGGGPYRGAFRITTRGAADEREPAPPQPPTQSGASQDGSPVEFQVPVGVRVEITALPADTGFQLVTKTEATPDRANESRDVVLSISPAKRRAPGTVTGRAIDPDGIVLANTALRWGGLPANSGILDAMSANVVHTDRGGLFTIARPAFGEVRSERIRLSAPWSRSGSGLDPTMVATIETRPRTADEVVDVGDVHFKAVPRLVAGHVVDPQGRGLAYASVMAWRSEDSSSAPPSRMLVSSRSGAFAMHFPWMDATLGVAAGLQDWFIPGTTVDEHQRLVVPRQDVAVGASDVRIELHRCGTVRGEFLLGPGLEPSDVVLEISPSCAARVVRGSEEAFRLVGIPGEWSLAARSRTGSLLANVDAIRFEEDAEHPDGRLLPLDLSGVIRMPVEVTDGAGAPVAGADLAVLPPVGHRLGREHAKTDPFGREVVVAARGDGPLWVGASGLHWQRVPLEPIAKTIRLAPGIRVVGSIDVPPDLSETILVRAAASLTPSDDTPGDELLGRLAAVSTWHPLRDGAVEFVVSGAGDCFVQCWLRDARRPESRGECLSAQRIAVAESVERQRFRIEVRAEDLTAAIARLRR